MPSRSDLVHYVTMAADLRTDALALQRRPKTKEVDQALNALRSAAIAYDALGKAEEGRGG